MVTALVLAQEEMILSVALVSILIWTLSWLQQSVSHCRRPTHNKLLKTNLSQQMEAEQGLMQELEAQLEFNRVYKRSLKRMTACMTATKMSHKMMTRRPCKKLWLSP